MKSDAAQVIRPKPLIAPAGAGQWSCSDDRVGIRRVGPTPYDAYLSWMDCWVYFEECGRQLANRVVVVDVLDNARWSPSEGLIRFEDSERPGNGCNPWQPDAFWLRLKEKFFK